LNVQYAFGSEDCTGIVNRIKYDSTTNTFTGFPSLLDRGVPVKSYYQTDSPVQSTDNNADPKYLRAMRLMGGFLGALPNFQVRQHPQAFQIKIKSHWSWFYLREQQLLLVVQDPTHLVAKWCNRLLSATTELCLGNQSISINYLHDIIENDTYSKLDHGLTKSDINPKDRQNFSSCLKLTSNDLFNILNATAL
ncbi:unnamed protein product, partial [Rotaria socialis]